MSSSLGAATERSFTVQCVTLQVCKYNSFCQECTYNRRNGIEVHTQSLSECRSVGATQD
jgi:hypothetical protein